ncbi:hypothetical protein MKC54_09825 [[Clostridium] innocuum]|nr:hypothetical protein [[Clostridium] innocuum]MCR0577185.1 hypothetical protein [[Clostridium] innocuum]
MTKSKRCATVMTRFSDDEMQCVDELRNRVNINTNGKLFRNIILNVALHPEFDFLACDINSSIDVGDVNKKYQLVLYEKITTLVNMLQEENILLTDKTDD